MIDTQMGLKNSTYGRDKFRKLLWLKKDASVRPVPSKNHGTSTSRQGTPFRSRNNKNTNRPVNQGDMKDGG